MDSLPRFAPHGLRWQLRNVGTIKAIARLPASKSGRLYGAIMAKARNCGERQTWCTCACRGEDQQEAPRVGVKIEQACYSAFGSNRLARRSAQAKRKRSRPACR